MPDIDFNLFFFQSTHLAFQFLHHSCTQLFYYGLGLHHQRKAKHTSLWFPCQINLENYNLLFLCHRKIQPSPFRQKIRKSNCSDNVSHPLIWHMSVAKAIWWIWGIQAIIAMYTIIDNRYCSTEWFSNLQQILKYKIKLRKKLRSFFIMARVNGLSVKAWMRNRGTEWGKWGCPIPGIEVGMWRMRGMGGNAGNQGGNAENRGGNASNKVEIEKTK